MATQLLMAKSPEEAISAKNASAVFIAGGTEVNRLGSDAAAAADTLISLKKCAGLHDIVADGDKIRIGAMCTFQQIIESNDTPEYLKEAAHFMASRTKRNMATIGGNIAALRDDSYMLPTLFAVHAELEVLTAGGTEFMDAYAYMEAAETGGKKKKYFYDEQGEIKSDESVYDDGTGTIAFHDDGTFTWHEDQSEYGVDMVFEWVPVQGD